VWSQRKSRKHVIVSRSEGDKETWHFSLWSAN
jgi:hypothetical protein